MVATRLMADLGTHAKVQDEIQQSCALALGQIGDCDADELDTLIRSTLMPICG